MSINEMRELAELPHVRLVVLRHSKSCSNLVRAQAPPDAAPSHPAVLESQRIEDPPLTEEGVRRAEQYRPTLHHRLWRAGFEVSPACVGSSALLRAKQTAALLFPNKRLVTFRGLGEEGEVPENTPHGERYRRPDWRLFLREAAGLVRENHVYDLVAVAHGSFLRHAVAQLTGQSQPRLSNMSGYLLKCRLRRRTLVVEDVAPLPYPRPEDFDDADGADKCRL